MRIGRVIVAVLLVAGLLFGAVGSPAALAAGSGGKPTADELYKLKREYLAGLMDADAIPVSAGKNASLLKPATPAVADLDVPAEVRQLESFKRGDVQVVIGPLGRALLDVSPAPSGSSVPTISDMQAAHQATAQALVQAGVSLGSRVDFYVTYNGIAGWVKTADIAKIKSIVGRDKVHYARVLSADLGASVGLIGSGPSGVWTDPGVDGTGMYVGVIDTGIDWKHPDFGGDVAWTYPANFPTAKVVAGYDFGDNDGNPMDDNGHGTHVAGIMAADGLVKGVAPKAKIVFAKIVASAEGSASSVDIMRAFDYMADPLNLDGGPEGTHPAVAAVNMSFGSVAGFVDPTDPEMVAIENCIASGITVSLSAGNSAEYYDSTPWYPWYPDYSMVGSPALTPGSIAVASSDNAGYTMYGMTDTSSTAWGYELPGASYFYPAATDPPRPESVWGPTQDVPYTVVGTTNPTTLGPGALAGQIAVMQRRSGADRLRYARAAQDKGAIGVVYYDITDKYLGTGFLYGFQNDGTYCARVTIPVVFTRNVSAAWSALPTKTVRFNTLVTAPWTVVANGGPADAVSSFSSWGAPPDLSFKPDVTAPGGGIWSTVPVAQGTYDVYSGTSMAAPHVAAAAALIKQAHPTWTPADVKKALSNTAKLTTDARTGVTYSPRRIGAGRINVSDALHTPVFVAETATGKPSIALGSVASWQSTPITFSLTLTNSSQAPMMYAVSGTAQWTRSDLAPTLIPGAVVTSSSPTVIVPGNGSASVVITVDATSVALSTSRHPFVEGFVSFTPSILGLSVQEAAELPVLHVPYMGFLGEYNDFDIASYGPTFNPLVDLPGELNFSGWWAYYVLDIPGYTETGVTWPSDPTYFDYMMGMGWDGVYSLDNVAINPAKPYVDVWGAIQPTVWMLRNAQSLSVDITDSTGTPVKHLDTAEWMWKSDLGDSRYPLPIYDSNPNDGTPWVWYGENEEGSVVPDGQYHMVLSATPQKLVNRLTSDAPQVIDFPVAVDSVNPICVINTIMPAPSGREVKWTTTDAAPSSGIWGQLVWWRLADGSTGGEWVGPSVRSFVAPADAVEANVYAWDNANNLSSFSAPSTRTIVSSWKGLGSVSPAGTTTVHYGTSQSYVFTPAPGYSVVNVLVDGVRMMASGGYTFTNVTKNHTIAVTFGDVLPPALSLTTKGDILSRSSEVLIPFEVSDSSGVVMLSVKDGGALVLTGAPAVSPLHLNLKDGQHYLEVIAEDASGNKVSAMVGVTVDTRNPIITLTAPVSDRADSATLRIAGTVLDEGSGLRSLAVGGDIVIPYGDGSFVYDALLIKGANEIILEATDNIGNIAQTVLNVTYEPRVPKAPVSFLVVLTIGRSEIVVNGMPFKIDAAPVIRNNRTLLPIRVLIETLGGRVVWNASSRTVDVFLGTRSVSVGIGTSMGYVDGKPVRIDPANPQVVPEIIQNRTFLPLRFIAEGLGLDLAWDAASQTISITYWP